MVNSLEDVKYKIAIEIDVDRFNKSLGRVLRNAQRVVRLSAQKMETSMTKSFITMTDNQRKIFNTHLDKLVEATRENATQRIEAEKRANHLILKSRGKIYNSTMSMVKKEDKELKHILNSSRMGILENVGRGGLYRLGSMLANGITEGFENFFKTGFEIRSAVIKSSNSFSEQEIQKLRKEAQKIAVDVPFSTLDIAQALKSGAMFGLSGKRLVDTTRLSSKLAIATGDSLEGSLAKTIKIANSFGIKDSKKVENLLSQILIATNKSALDMEKINVGMSYVGASASTKGITTATTLAMLGVLNSNGLDGSKAGTSGNQFLTKLIQNSSREKVEGLIGRSISDEKGNVSVLTVLEGLKEKLKGLSNTDKSSVLNDIFGIRAERAVNILLSHMGEYKDLLKEIEHSQGQLDRQMAQSSADIYYKKFRFLSKMQQVIENTFVSLTPLINGILNIANIVADVILFISSEFPMLTKLASGFVITFLAKTTWGLLSHELAFMKVVFLNTIASMKKGFNVIIGKIFLVNKQLTLTQRIFRTLGNLALVGLIIGLTVLTVKIFDAINGSEVLTNKWNETKTILESILKVVFEIVANLLGIDTSALNLDTENIEASLIVINEALTSIRGALKGVSNFVKAHPTLSKIIAFGSIALVILAKIIGFFSAIGSSIAWIGQAIMWVVGIVGAILAVPVEVAVAIVAAVVAIVGLIIYFRKEIWAFVKAVGEWLGNFFKGLLEGIVNAILHPIDTIKSMWSSLKSFFTGNKITPEVETSIKNNVVTTQKALRHATGTNKYTSGLPTTLNEHGDEAVFLPFGSMIANNTTTREMLNELRGIRSNGSGGTVISKNEIGDIYITVQGTNDTPNDIENAVRNIFMKLSMN